MRILFLSLSLVALSLAAAGCRSGGESARDAMGEKPAAATGESLYTRTGMHFEAKEGKYMMYTTNYIGVDKYLPPGTRLTYQGMSRKRMSFTDDNGSDYVIEFVAKHSLMSVQDWMEQQFTAVAEALPEGLSNEEQDAIAEGVAKVGMSRQAVLLALGHPPKSLSPSEQDNVLTYERKRMMRYTVRFGADDRVVDVGR